jgi:hypothetical protein
MRAIAWIATIATANALESRTILMASFIWYPSHDVHLQTDYVSYQKCCIPFIV